MPRKYAEGTEVEVTKTKADIERLLTQHGATGFASAWEDNRSILMFRLRGRTLRYAVEVPNPANFHRTAKGHTRHKKDLVNKAAEAEHKRRWRALYLIIRAKLEIVESSDDPSITFDREFMADIMLPGGQTIGDLIIPQIHNAITTGKMPKLLPSG